MSSCPSCQAKLKEGAKFCVKCGHKVVASGAAKSKKKKESSSKKRCVECKKRVKGAFCNACGTKQPAASRGPKPSAVSSSGVSASPGNAKPRCSKCNKRMKPHSLFCTGCGTRTALGKESQRKSLELSEEDKINLFRMSRAESYTLTEEEQADAMRKIEELLGEVEIQSKLKIRCILDSVERELEVETMESILNAQSLQAAWNLSAEQELHITFTGLRAPNGDEIPFEESDEVPWRHIPFWEEVIFADEVYEILYEDDRDVDVDALSDREIKTLEQEFDSMDLDGNGYLTKHALTRFFKRSAERARKQATETHGAMQNLAGLRESTRFRYGAAVSSAESTETKIKAEVGKIMAMDVDGSGRVELHEFVRVRAGEMLVRRSSMRQSSRGKRLTLNLSQYTI